MKKHTNKESKVSFYKTSKSQRIISSKTKFLDDYLYRCRGLSMWYRYRDCHFRWEEVLFFLEIEYKKYSFKDFVKIVEENFNDNFYELLIDMQNYFNDHDYKKRDDVTADFNKWKYEPK